MSRLCRVLALAAAAALAASGARAQLLARVEPGWSPFVQARVVQGTPEGNLLAEARGLLVSEPARVAQVLGRGAPARGPAARLAEGLRADALYRTGTKGLAEAQKLYRGVVTSDAPAAEQAWAQFMLGNIRKIHGYVGEAEVSYRTALAGPAAPWRPAALFDLAALELEAGRPAQARPELEVWLRDYAGEPGRPLALHLLVECLARLGDDEAALARLSEARRLDPAAWTVRPEVGYAVAELLRRSGNTEEAVRVLEMIPRAAPGSVEGAKARLTVGAMREAEGNVAAAARSYGLLLDEGAGAEVSREAVLRLAYLGALYREKVVLTDSYPAYRIFYRPGPTLEQGARDKDPAAAQRAVLGLGHLARQEGRPLDSLRLFARSFQQYPKTPESGRAYDAFMDTLEAHFAERLRAKAYSDVISAYEAFRGPMGWVATRDRGAVDAKAAEAYRALGAPALARAVYERLAREGTRVLSPAELEQRLLEARAGEGDPEAVRALAGAGRGGEAQQRAEAALGRRLAAQGRPSEAREHLRRAAELTADPATRLALLTEADRLAGEEGRLDEQLAGLSKRRPLRQALPPGPDRDAWERSAALSEARLRFAKGDYANAILSYGTLKDLGPEDRYLLAVAEKRAGNAARARELFTALAQGKDPVFANLAGFHLQVEGARDALRKKF
ncbi:MAG: tetratricopeptide repeat protein [Deltaproteobacteria bacterium]|nr:tetratricopeptide repeat protein [Deltaproteobacteria bacterium]